MLTFAGVPFQVFKKRTTWVFVPFTQASQVAPIDSKTGKRFPYCLYLKWVSLFNKSASFSFMDLESKDLGCFPQK